MVSLAPWFCTKTLGSFPVKDLNGIPGKKWNCYSKLPLARKESSRPWGFWTNTLGSSLIGDRSERGGGISLPGDY